MFKLLVLAAVVAYASAASVAVVTSPVVVGQPAVVGYSATKVDAKVPASTTLVKHNPVVATPVATPVVYSAGVPVYSAGVPTVYSAHGVPTVYSNLAGVPTVYSTGVAGVPVVIGHQVTHVVKPVEQHGYSVVY